jgi:3-keto-disaccharide hydrolase
MRALNGRVSLGIAVAMLISASVVANTFVEDFSAMPAGTCYPDGSVFGVWQFVYNGYGCNGFVSSNSNTMLFEQPATSTSPDETHAALVTGPSISGDFTLQVSAATTNQLRANGVPNPWEVAWVLWHYTDNAHFYYFLPKPNGWELGKEDPAYPGNQRFLASGSSPTFPIGQWYRIGVTQSGQTIQVSVNGVVITTFTDRERAYSSGRVGLYSEDAEVYFDNVSVVTSTKTKKGRP